MVGSTVNPALAFRMMYPKVVSLSCATEGRGISTCQTKSWIISLFSYESARYRLPENQPLDKPTELIKLDPQSGWLAERWRENRQKRARPAAYPDYNGNRHDAFWYFDKEMAEATENYYKEIPNRKEQHISFLSEGKWLDFKEDSHSQYEFTPYHR